jgi:hypothetical protein
MVARGQLGIIRRINSKLAPEGKVVSKTQRKGVHGTGREYQLLDCQQGTKRYLSLSEVWDLAQELGVLAIRSRQDEV